MPVIYEYIGCSVKGPCVFVTCSILVQAPLKCSKHIHRYPLSWQPTLVPRLLIHVCFRIKKDDGVGALETLSLSLLINTVVVSGVEFARLAMFKCCACIWHTVGVHY